MLSKLRENAEISAVRYTDLNGIVVQFCFCVGRSGSAGDEGRVGGVVEENILRRWHCRYAHRLAEKNTY